MAGTADTQDAGVNDDPHLPIDVGQPLTREKQGRPGHFASPARVGPIAMGSGPI